jgi:acyl-CoA synthetase (AMP-forming)/AMP-acid ligase II
MPPREVASLWELTAGAGPLDRRFLSDAQGRVTLAALEGATRFAGAEAMLRGARVILIAETQLAAALALLELDGLARRIVLCTPDLSPRYLAEVKALAGADVVVSERPVPELEQAGLPRVAPGALSPRAGAAAPTPLEAPTEWALFTSGTTGPPKLAVHTLRSLTGAIGAPATVANEAVWSTFYDIRRYGGLQILLRALLGGGSMVLSVCDEPVANFLSRAAAAGVTFLSGTPTHWRTAVLSSGATAIAPRDVRLSGEAADQAILDKLRATYPNARVAHAFASTEAGVAFEVADGLAGLPPALIGREGAAVELRIVDETLRVRSDRVAARYLGDTAGPLVDDEGFVDTKDILQLRGGRYFFAGRRDGVINVGGLKVHPEEVEAVINGVPGVQMSLVKARRSPIIGSIVVAEVVPTPPPGDVALDADAARDLEAGILAACRKALAWYKVPATVRLIPALDVSPAGKLIRARA